LFFFKFCSLMLRSQGQNTVLITAIDTRTTKYLYTGFIYQYSISIMTQLDTVMSLLRYSAGNIS